MIFPGLIPLAVFALASGILFSAPGAGLSSPRPMDVFLVAHQDDWQLFMGDVAFKGVRRGNHSLFIYLTAGDENRGPDYWRTRENAALKSTLLAANSAGDTGAIRCATAVVLAHAVRRCTVANTISYFLRLPDGRRDGYGFEQNSFQSLRKLHAGRISAIGAVDTTARYNGWSDLTATIREIVTRDRPAGSPVTLHTSDPNAAVNPGDHSDHQLTGLVAAKARASSDWSLIYYVGYALAARPDNRSRAQAREKTALFLVYDREMLLANREWSTYAERPRFYSLCMLRTYARKVRLR